MNKGELTRLLRQIKLRQGLGAKGENGKRGTGEKVGSRMWSLSRDGNIRISASFNLGCQLWLLGLLEPRFFPPSLGRGISFPVYLFSVHLPCCHRDLLF